LAPSDGIQPSVIHTYPLKATAHAAEIETVDSGS
jgi:hypothetical protein